ncbi:MAG: hypothetical protein AAF560_24745 [Acidobacteriota bacterium]
MATDRHAPAWHRIRQGALRSGFAATVLAATLLSACSEAPPSHLGVDPAAKSQASAESSQFVEQELGQLRSPFTRETVLELNAIVARSLSVIGRFDTARKEHAASPSTATPQTLETYASLAAEAISAREDMSAANQRLRRSGEHFNEAILAAMIRFVDGVPEEIEQEAANLVARGA